MIRPTASHSHQRGVILIEALIAILIFSIGILAAVGMQAVAVKNATDSRSRSEAAFFTDQLLAQMWLDSNIGAINTTNVTTANYAFAGGPPASAPARLKSWVAQVQAKLPGSTQIVTVVNPAPKPPALLPSGATVTIEIDWQLPDEAAGTPAHRHVVTAAVWL